MKTQPTLKASLTTGVMLLSGVFLFAQVASTAVPAAQSTAPAAKVAPQKASAATAQPYKDPEDMTTRAAKFPINATTAVAANTGDSAAEQKKHLAGVKYSDRTAEQNGALDAKQANDKKGNKVDVFTVKQ
jgi:hypothetical protein